MIDMISFRELLINAKNGDEKALMEMFDLFRPHDRECEPQC